MKIDKNQIITFFRIDQQNFSVENTDSKAITKKKQLKYTNTIWPKLPTAKFTSFQINSKYFVILERKKILYPARTPLEPVYTLPDVSDQYRTVILRYGRYEQTESA